VLMNAHNRSVYHLDGSIMSSSQCLHNSAPHASPTPANEAIVASGIGAELLWQIAPRCARSQDPKDVIQDSAVIHPWDASRLVRQHRLDGGPFMVGEFVAHDSRLRLGGLNHGLAAGLNTPLSRPFWSLSLRKADSLCSLRALSIMTLLGPRVMSDFEFAKRLSRPPPDQPWSFLRCNQLTTCSGGSPCRRKSTSVRRIRRRTWRAA
jgi:hypothetical protein